MIGPSSELAAGSPWGTPSTSLTQALAPAQRDERSFQGLLDRSQQGADAAGATGRSQAFGQTLRGAAEQLVATAFIQPLFQHMRDDPFRSDRFHGGAGEKAFAPLLHTELADRVASAPGWPLVDSIVRSLTPGERAPADAQPRNRIDTRG